MATVSPLLCGSSSGSTWPISSAIRFAAKVDAAPKQDTITARETERLNATQSMVAIGQTAGTAMDVTEPHLFLKTRRCPPGRELCQSVAF